MNTAGTITFKAKVKPVHYHGEDEPRYMKVDIKQALTRADYKTKPGTSRNQHTYYNSDMFLGMLKHAMREVAGGHTSFRLDALPEGVTVDTSGFLAEVTVELPTSFWM